MANSTDDLTLELALEKLWDYCLALIAGRHTLCVAERSQCQVVKKAVEEFLGVCLSANIELAIAHFGDEENHADRNDLRVLAFQNFLDVPFQHTKGAKVLLIQNSLDLRLLSYPQA